jgi:hypothetical protein
MELLDPVIKKWRLMLGGCALKCMAHDSLLDGEKDDIVLMGAGTLAWHIWRAFL